MSDPVDFLLTFPQATIHIRGKLVSVEIHAEGRVFTGESYQHEKGGDVYSASRRLTKAAQRAIDKYQEYLDEQAVAKSAEAAARETAKCRECGAAKPSEVPA